MSFWPEQFDESGPPSPKGMFEEQGKLLARITGGLAYAEVEELDEMSAIRSGLPNDFKYSFDLRGKLIPNYRFRVLSFAHDITMYPVKFDVDQSIAGELDLKFDNPFKRSVLELVSPDELEPFVKSVLGSDRVSKVVSAILRLSK